MAVTMHPIGTVRTDGAAPPRHWSVSEETGILDIAPEFARGLRDIQPGQHIVVLFHFHDSPGFTSDALVQTPPHKGVPLGVFSICSPRRPNPIGLSVLEVINVVDTHIHVKGVDMLDGTPILDIKPHITG
ncbi:tRNA (N6-threonylcarbamoyladenosine(37)-N6)-methyltransferase TrmO [Desulfohalobium retbaense]|uniref:TsaA-like domain-containing protein n=1 Tax=Desulfohalobium retbaense (strain ATCC 49708 / DSM 5692 / JCM 16813 / HR100) TaxID=485915 RepID=C8X3X6_DESRD|nr:tRNA (N6-threonylcarbamoyladenosine(37)-N6)-methyltransferase TrmO [Desulfohalobium retbaense]ACV69123.1 protein of unknown function UPF0066 [Desulfohalobium retbaense DSM 5692]